MIKMEPDNKRIKLSVQFGDEHAAVWIPESSLDHPPTVASALLTLGSHIKKKFNITWSAADE